ncbi:MAG: crossover junction endodeoxyribonuclease RuvC [Candidatus Paceibacterota bacterium]|jgi:crossover junction endodeoxyribonuclease RuvC
MIVLGIDPGYDRLGLAIVKQEAGQQELLHSDCFVTDKKTIFSERLLAIGEEVEKVIKDWEPEMVAMEKLFFTVNQKTAMNVAEARGVITYLSAKHGLKLSEYTPLEIKTCITGYGSADKKQMIEMIPKLIKIKKIIKHDDEYDAIGVALTHLARAPLSALSTFK